MIFGTLKLDKATSDVMPTLYSLGTSPMKKYSIVVSGSDVLMSCGREM